MRGVFRDGNEVAGLGEHRSIIVLINNRHRERSNGGQSRITSVSCHQGVCKEGHLLKIQRLNESDVTRIR